MEKILEILTGIAEVIIPKLKKPDSVAGIKETSDVLIGVNELALFLCEKLKDGVQFSDAVDFYSKVTGDEDFKAKMVAMYEDYQKIPAEVKDLDGGEIMEVLMIQANYVPNFLACFKKDEAPKE